LDIGMALQGGAWMDLKTAGLLIAFATGVLGLLGSVGAYFESIEGTKNSISQLQKDEAALHKSASKRIDELQTVVNATITRVETLERKMDTDDSKLQTDFTEIDRLRHWIEDISHRNLANDQR
jgi:hypothetical protein